MFWEPHLSVYRIMVSCLYLRPVYWADILMVDDLVLPSRIEEMHATKGWSAVKILWMTWWHARQWRFCELCVSIATECYSESDGCGWGWSNDFLCRTRAHLNTEKIMNCSWTSVTFWIVWIVPFGSISQARYELGILKRSDGAVLWRLSLLHITP